MVGSVASDDADDSGRMTIMGMVGLIPRHFQILVICVIGLAEAVQTKRFQSPKQAHPRLSNPVQSGQSARV